MRVKYGSVLRPGSVRVGRGRKIAPPGAFPLVSTDPSAIASAVLTGLGFSLALAFSLAKEDSIAASERAEERERLLQRDLDQELDREKLQSNEILELRKVVEDEESTVLEYMQLISELNEELCEAFGICAVDLNGPTSPPPLTGDALARDQQAAYLLWGARPGEGRGNLRGCHMTSAIEARRQTLERSKEQLHLLLDAVRDLRDHAKALEQELEATRHALITARHRLHYRHHHHAGSSSFDSGHDGDP